MSEPKTKKTGASVEGYLGAIADADKQKDARAVLRLMQRVTGEQPKMWGTSIVGFGEYRYRYASGREGNWPIAGFSARAQNLTLYLMTGFAELEPLLKKLGTHSTGKSCLYIRRLSDVDPAVLERIVRQAVREARAKLSPKAPKKNASASKKNAGASKKNAGASKKRAGISKKKGAVAATSRSPSRRRS